MLKKYKSTMIITSVIMLLPIILGLLLWNKLPENMPIHWNAAGEIDGWTSRAKAVFMLPAAMLALHWLCVLITGADPKHKDIDRKPMMLVLWICPFVSLVVSAVSYVAALGYNLSVDIILPMALGVLFVIIGNYMPKCKQNYTIGIKVPWALADEANWNATHRFAGWVWVIGGVGIALFSLLGSFWVFLVLTLTMAILPIIYSYLYYLKHKKETDE